MDDWYSAADVLALTSREDPFPSIVLEAMAAGLPTVAFEEAGGIPDLLHRHRSGAAVEMADTEAMVERLLEVAAGGARPGERTRLSAIARHEFSFAAYAEFLLQTAHPTLAAISVVVPNYNYARYLPERLASIFAQTHPVREVLLLDDASTDDSVATARRIAADWRRSLVVVEAAVNSGSVFAQWRRAAEQARADYLWIAEADDGADPTLLDRLAATLATAPKIDLAFCDSRAIDAAGAALWPDHRDYYRQHGAAGLQQDGIFAAADFARRFLGDRNLILNVSAVLWRRSALLAALDRCGTALDDYRLAGDWRIYVELMAASSGQVAYVATPLNHHRRHDAGVTQSMDPARHAAEIGRARLENRRRLGLEAEPQSTAPRRGRKRAKPGTAP